MWRRSTEQLLTGELRKRGELRGSVPIQKAWTGQLIEWIGARQRIELRQAPDVVVGVTEAYGYIESPVVSLSFDLGRLHTVETPLSAYLKFSVDCAEDTIRVGIVHDRAGDIADELERRLVALRLIHRTRQIPGKAFD